MAHLDPLSRENLPELEPQFRKVEEHLGFVPHSVLTMGRRPDLVRAFSELTSAVHRPGTVSKGLKAMVGTIASAAAGCRYCQAHSVASAERHGVSAAKLRAVWDFEHSGDFTPAEVVALRLARDGAQVPCAVGAEHFAELGEHFTEHEIVELVAVIALFGFLNRWNDILATELEPIPLGAAQSHLAPHGWAGGKHVPEGSGQDGEGSAAVP